MDKRAEEPKQEIKVTAPEELLTFLVENGIRKSRNATKSLLMRKQIKINGRIETRHNHLLEAGDVVSISKNDRTHDTKKLKNITIIYEDEYFVVVDKEPRVLSISTGKDHEETAYNILNRYVKSTTPNGRVFVLHRLDRETSGLMLYAKTAHAQELMQKKWDEAVKARPFVVVVEGRPTPTEGTITSWLTENKNFQMFSDKFDNGGQKSITHYETIKGTRKFTMLKLTLDTQRKNQARVHMQHIGHPIVGDKKYGSSINTIKRVAIHANEFVFVHPYTNELMEFKSPIPKKMEILVEPLPVLDRRPPRREREK